MLKADDCFTEDAVYTEPPDKQVYIGHEALYEFFGGDEKPKPPMFMTVVKVRDGKISNWREYQSTLDWEAFTGFSPLDKARKG